MKRIKRLIVFALTFAMVLGMTITASAAETATITIQNLSDNAVVTYRQIVEPSNTSETGWKAVDEEVEAALATLTTEDVKDPIEAYVAASASARMDALANISTNTEGGATIQVSKAGLYLINATDPDGKFIYKPMIASVGFEFDEAGKPQLQDTEVIAKKGPVVVEKTGDQKFVAIGDKIEYTVTTIIPYIPDGSENQVFTVTDTISGGEFVKDEASGKFTVSLSYKDVETTMEADVVNNNDGTQTFTLDLVGLTQEKDNEGNTNIYANTELTIKYLAKATDVEVVNDAYPTYMDNQPGQHVSFESITGNIEVTKLSEKEETLSGAKFIIIWGEKYAVLDDDNTLVEWTDDKEQATPIESGDNGIAKAFGFDRDENYKVLEVAAPEGYTLNEDAVDAEWTTEKYTEDGVLIKDQLAQATVVNTTLITLPYTGGSGTVGFTVFGVILMSAASALYLVNRKKSQGK